MNGTYGFYERTAPGQPSQALTLGTLMSHEVQALSPQHTVRDALMLMQAHHIHHIPIVDDTGHLVGLVSETDLLRFIPIQPDGETASGDHPPLLTPIKELMVRDVATLPAQAHVADAIRLFQARRFHSAPVVDGEQRVIGMITETDLMKLLFLMVGN